MTLTFDQAQASVQDSQPRYVWELNHGTVFYRGCTGQRDIYMGSTKFPASTGQTSDTAPGDVTNQKETTIVLPSSHTFVGRWFQAMSPPARVTAKIWLYQVEANSFLLVWQGEVTAVSPEGHMVKLTVAATVTRRMQKRLPLIGADSKCAVVLFDGMCKADRATFTYAGHVTFVDGRTVNVAWDVAVPAGDTWAGTLIHLPTGEPMLVVAKSGLTLTLKAPVAGMKVGDSITVSHICGHSIADCRDVFANVVNYIGLPNKPTQNPTFPTGLGVGDSK